MYNLCKIIFFPRIKILNNKFNNNSLKIITIKIKIILQHGFTITLIHFKTIILLFNKSLIIYYQLDQI
jgi:hypothetical protein